MNATQTKQALLPWGNSSATGGSRAVTEWSFHYGNNSGNTIRVIQIWKEPLCKRAPPPAQKEILLSTTSAWKLAPFNYLFCPLKPQNQGRATGTPSYGLPALSLIPSLCYSEHCRVEIELCQHQVAPQRCFVLTKQWDSPQPPDPLMPPHPLVRTRSKLPRSTLAEVDHNGITTNEMTRCFLCIWIPPLPPFTPILTE